LIPGSDGDVLEKDEATARKASEPTGGYNFFEHHCLPLGEQRCQRCTQPACPFC